MFLKFSSYSRILYSIGSIIALLFVGSVGFMVIEQYTFIEAFYMTVITVSTVGFREVKTLSPTGMIFTSFLIVISIGTFAYGISAITSFFVSGEYANHFKRMKAMKKIKDFNNHVIICGFGRVGEKAVSDIQSHNQEFVVIERSPEKLEYLQAEDNVLYLKGDATQDADLIEAGIEKAKALITTLPNDADNLYVVLTARELNKNMTIISRASKTESVHKLRIAGADNVIMPDSVGGAHMASLVVNPDVLEFLDHISVSGAADINLEEICFSDLPSDYVKKTLGELKIRNRFGVNVIGFKTATGDFVINPGPDTVIDEDSKFFVLGNREQIAEIRKSFS